MLTAVFIPGVLEDFISATTAEEYCIIQFPVLLDGIPLFLGILHNVQQLDPWVTSQPAQVNGACSKVLSYWQQNFSTDSVAMYISGERNFIIFKIKVVTVKWAGKPGWENKHVQNLVGTSWYVIS